MLPEGFGRRIAGYNFGKRMKIVIAGAGEVGQHLAKMLSGEDHDITVIDSDAKLLDDLAGLADIVAIEGDCTTFAALRKARGMTQEELAEALEVSRQTVGSLENGRYNPSILLAFKIARLFETTIEEVFLYEEEGEE